MSSCMPLTTKKNGTNTPKATPVSLESNPGTSRSLSSWRVIIPAAKPPSSRSSPSSNASSASAKTSTTIQRTASCELFSIVCSNSRSAGDLDRTANSATATASPTKREQDQRVVDRALRSTGSASAAGSGRTRRPRPPRAGTCPAACAARRCPTAPGSACRSRWWRAPSRCRAARARSRPTPAAPPIAVRDRERHHPADDRQPQRAARRSAAGRSRSRRRRTACPSPRSAKNCMNSVTSRPSTCGPMTTPSTSSATTVGTSSAARGDHRRERARERADGDDGEERVGVDRGDQHAVQPSGAGAGPRITCNG